MTITYAYFRGNRAPYKGELSKVHAFDSNAIRQNHPICCTIIYTWGKDKIPIDKKDILVDDLCKNCQHYLIMRGINWFKEPVDIKKLAEKIKDVNRGDSLDVNLDVDTSGKVTIVMNHVLHEHKLVLTTVDGEFKEAKISSDSGNHYTLIFSDQSLLELFTVIYKGLDNLELLPCEVVEGMEQLIFENKNK